MKFKLPGMDIAKRLEENATWEDIIEYENQGCDVRELKAKFLARQEALKDSEDSLIRSRFTMERVNDETTDLSRLDAYAKEINNTDSRIVRDTIGRAPLFFGKSKWVENIQNCRMIYASVIQCHPQLWKEITEDIAPASVLYIYSMNPKYSRNIEVLKKACRYLNEFRDQEIDKIKYSKEMVKLHNEMDDSQSAPHIMLDKTILSDLGLESDADFRVTSSLVYDDSPVQNNKLPENGIVPFLQFKELDTETAFSYATRIIPSKYYTK